MSIRATSRSIAWSSIEGAGTSAILILSTLTLARLLDPAAYGAAAIVLSIVIFLNLFADRFFHDVLVQRPVLEARHLHTAFWSTLLIAGIAVLTCQALAGALAEVYDEPKLEVLLRWASLSLALNALCAIQSAHLKRRLRFKKIAIRNMAAIVLAASCAITSALMGWGAWSLIIQQVVLSAATLVITLVIAEYWPRFVFDKSCLRDLVSFSTKALSANLVINGTSVLFLTIAGYRFGTVVAGQLDIAWRIIESLRFMLTNAASPLMLAVFSRRQDKPQKLRASLSEAIELHTLAIFPICAGVFVSIDYFIALTIGPQWAGAADIIRAVAVGGMLAAAGQVFLVLFKAIDKPMLGLNVTLAGFVVAIGLVLIAPIEHAIWVGLIWAARFLVMLAFSLWLANRTVGYGVWRFSSAIAPPLVAVLTMATLTSLLNHLWLSAVHEAIGLMLVAIAGVAAYFASLLLVYPSRSKTYARRLRLFGKSV